MEIILIKRIGKIFFWNRLRFVAPELEAVKLENALQNRQCNASFTFDRPEKMYVNF